MSLETTLTDIIARLRQGRFPNEEAIWTGKRQDHTSYTSAAHSTFPAIRGLLASPRWGNKQTPITPMNHFFTIWLTICLCGGLLLGEFNCVAASEDAPKIMATNRAPAALPAFARFVTQKRLLAEGICKKHEHHLPSTAMGFFAAAQKGDWLTTSNLFSVLEAANHPSSGGWSPPAFWGTVHETYGVYELLHAWTPEFLVQFGDGVVNSIPAGSIYFGGTEAGRFAVSLFSQSHSQGRPFFTLTQSALSDSSYSSYLRDMYGDKINLPSDNDIRRCMEDYKKDAQARLEHDQAFPSEPRRIRQGEDVRLVNGEVQINGPVCVMAIHALVIKLIMDRNPGREFYYEESYELETIDPFLTPHEFIFKLNRQPVGRISPEIIRADREFWTHKTDTWLGAWLKSNSTVEEITNFVNRTFVQSQPEGFKGNIQLIHDGEARYAFSKLRCAIAGLYAWRATHSKDPAEQQRMTTEADIAFRQAFAMCPSNAEVAMRYANFLIAAGRTRDALSVVSISCQLYPDHPAMHDLLEHLRVLNAPSR